MTKKTCKDCKHYPLRYITWRVTYIQPMTKEIADFLEIPFKENDKEEKKITVDGMIFHPCYRCTRNKKTDCWKEKI